MMLEIKDLEVNIANKSVIKDLDLNVKTVRCMFLWA